jgi:hypothetical protein
MFLITAGGIRDCVVVELLVALLRLANEAYHLRHRALWLTMYLILDVINDVSDGSKISDILILYRYLEFVFQGKHEIDQPCRVDVQVVGK